MVCNDKFYHYIILGSVFTSFQLLEYIHAPFNLNSSIYGSCFYMLTGLHGLHVLIGTIFILYSALRYYTNHFTPANHFAFGFAAIYWHFVDVIWLFLFIAIYINSCN